MKSCEDDEGGRRLEETERTSFFILVLEAAFVLPDSFFRGLGLTYITYISYTMATSIDIYRRKRIIRMILPKHSLDQ